MAKADKWRRIADNFRALPSQFGLREHSASILRRDNGGQLPWDTVSVIETETPITVNGGANPKVRFPTQREIALGMMSEGSVTVGPFTPQYASAGGIDRELFSGKGLENGDAFAIKITGPQHVLGCLYRVKNCNVDRALRVTLVCVPIEGS